MQYSIGRKRLVLNRFRIGDLRRLAEELTSIRLQVVTSRERRVRGEI